MEGERVSVSFTCQRCLQPVILDDSFTNMDDYARAELAREYNHSMNAPILLLVTTNHVLSSF